MKGSCILFHYNNSDEGSSKSNKKFKLPIFNERGGISIESVSQRREFFLGKSIAKLEHVLQKNGYKTIRKPSKHSGSKAKIIETLNSNADRNITRIQISPGSKRHGENVPYIKISTNSIGRLKIIGVTKSSGKYKTDNSENALLLYRRK